DLAVRIKHTDNANADGTVAPVLLLPESKSQCVCKSGPVRQLRQTIRQRIPQLLRICTGLVAAPGRQIRIPSHLTQDVSYENTSLLVLASGLRGRFWTLSELAQPKDVRNVPAHRACRGGEYGGGSGAASVPRSSVGRAFLHRVCRV